MRERQKRGRNAVFWLEAGFGRQLWVRFACASDELTPRW
ncbi:hypothetical protein L496_0817 [Bordetella holmesii CDC-H572-BH]|uniref:Uncharacterized protein n=1 Tax=Bordetella holmesii CDC-H585-BH TaxID=1331206 RepID=A0A158M0K3_9BORD|nr:hypothetical protein D558_3016 [Bordetella holmesii 44057]KAK81612.1 hypothetical protein L496_0817 [Bordetella holmesii CDC-H572-BH]KAK85899.1 hypothetical protein L573_0535 [Bordetella holmesii H620]KAK88544.1 hypothetical protein L497_0836 [Bordetella holmesii CDC-H585-BH]KCV02751.1 hypothetical protein L498_0541 [Bordetella holmesii CDC-H629-BH]KCV04134.1 hypothetical protein L501_0829 [Bordetella holmesii CDC-H719-BH]